VPGVWLQTVDELGDAGGVVLEDREADVEGVPQPGRPAWPALTEGRDFRLEPPGAVGVARLGREDRLVDHPVRVAGGAERRQHLGDGAGVTGMLGELPPLVAPYTHGVGFADPLP
jgi:hypothetical protein